MDAHLSHGFVRLQGYAGVRLLRQICVFWLAYCIV